MKYLSNNIFISSLTAASGTAGNNVKGNDLVLNPSLATGNALPGMVQIGGSRKGSSGSTVQNYRPVAWFGSYPTGNSDPTIWLNNYAGFSPSTTNYFVKNNVGSDSTDINSPLGRFNFKVQNSNTIIELNTEKTQFNNTLEHHITVNDDEVGISEIITTPFNISLFATDAEAANSQFIVAPGSINFNSDYTEFYGNNGNIDMSNAMNINANSQVNLNSSTIQLNSTGTLSINCPDIGVIGNAQFVNDVTVVGKLQAVGNDIEITNSDYGLILNSSSGSRYRIKIDDAGTISTELIEEE